MIYFYRYGKNNVFGFYEITNLSLGLVDGGWRKEETPHVCSTYANGTRIETTNVTKFCDDPRPVGGSLCHCNTTDPNEHSCDGVLAKIDFPCRKGMPTR